jgi:hypothetical protein
LPTPSRPQPTALRIELRDVAPLVWRRVLVSNQWTLASLHGYLQWVMGWTDSHAHEFQIGAGIVAPDWWIREVDFDTDTREYRDERRVSVAAVVSELGACGEFEYRYDMGDGWQHRLVIESLPRVAATQDLSLPACLAGENACPPEDVAVRVATSCSSRSLPIGSTSSTKTWCAGSEPGDREGTTEVQRQGAPTSAN